MKRMKATLRLVGLVLLSLLVCNSTWAQQPPDNVEGNWIIYSTNVEDGQVVVKHVQIAQYGNRITGHFDGPNQSGPIEGEVHGHHVRFNTVTKNVLHFGGDVFGDTITGSFGIHGKHASWEAIRTTAATQDYPTGTILSAMPMLTPPPPPAPAPTTYDYSAPTAPAPAPAPATSYADSSAGPAPESDESSEAPAATNTQTSSAPTPAPQTADQLDALVAPIALYPDALVAQVLAAASFPEQVAFADYWIAQNKNLTGTALAQAVDQEPWDPSVKALTQFPTVLHTLASNLTWTSNLGEAFRNQQADVMAAVQRMRAKAQAAGSLQSNSQITVTQPAPNTIVIQPANPQVVYVPQYNPTVVYGAPYVVPFYTPPVAFAGVGISFGPAISIGAVFGGGGFVGGVGFGWGWGAWGVNWGGWGGGGGTVIYNHNTYINNRTNNYYGGYHPWNGNHGAVPDGDHPYNPHGYYGNNGYYHPEAGWHPGDDTHYGPGGAYHANGYYGPDGGWHPNAQIPTKDQPNGGNNGDQGLIGGRGGVQNPNAGMNGPGVAPAGGYHNDTRGGGPKNDQSGLIGGEGGVRDKNAGMNGPGVAPAGGYHDKNQNRVDSGLGASRSHVSGDGRSSRMESNRGHASMHRAAEHHSEPHHSAPHHSGGGGGHRR
jgi:hypothetical protein